MGLDHAIYRVINCDGRDCDHYHDDVPADKRIAHLDTKDEVISWRKENWLHAWFVEHVNGGEDNGCWLTEVSLEQLAGLATTIERTIEAHDPSLLPPSAGFFFGSTDAGDYYWRQLERELGEIRQLLVDEQAHVAAGNPPHRYAYWCWW